MKLMVNDKDYGEVLLENVTKACLHLAGGGYTDEQTINAMQMQRDLMDGKEVMVKGSRVKLHDLGGEDE